MVDSKTVTFKNKEAEAKFWEDNYKEAWETGKPVTVKFAKNLSETINIRLDAKTLEVVRTKAQEKGLGPTQLIRMWILERINGKDLQTKT